MHTTIELRSIGRAAFPLLLLALAACGARNQSPRDRDVDPSEAAQGGEHVASEQEGLIGWCNPYLCPPGYLDLGSMCDITCGPCPQGPFASPPNSANCILYHPPPPPPVCTPGQFRLCCPFAQGCSCPGDKECNANGQWGPCEGAGARGQPCP
jgi:hypothetical protein